MVTAMLEQMSICLARHKKAAAGLLILEARHLDDKSENHEQSFERVTNGQIEVLLFESSQRA